MAASGKKPKKVLMVDFDGVLNSDEKTLSEKQLEVMDWHEVELAKLNIDQRIKAIEVQRDKYLSLIAELYKIEDNGGALTEKQIQKEKVLLNAVKELDRSIARINIETGKVSEYQQKESLDQELARKLAQCDQPTIRSPQLLQMIFKEMEQAGVKCMVASQRLRYDEDETNKPIKEIKNEQDEDRVREIKHAKEFKKSLQEAGLDGYLHLEDAKQMIQGIPQDSLLDETQKDKVLMAGAVCASTGLASSDVWLVDDSVRVYKDPIEAAKHKFYALDVSERGGDKYFGALKGWVGLMKELGVAEPGRARVNTVIDVLQANLEIKECLQKKPIDLDAVSVVLEKHSDIIDTVARKVSSQSLASREEYGVCYRDLQVLALLSSGVKAIVNFDPPQEPKPLGFLKSFFSRYKKEYANERANYDAYVRDMKEAPGKIEGLLGDAERIQNMSSASSTASLIGSLDLSQEKNPTVTSSKDWTLGENIDLKITDPSKSMELDDFKQVTSHPNPVVEIMRSETVMHNSSSSEASSQGRTVGGSERHKNSVNSNDVELVPLKKGFSP